MDALRHRTVCRVRDDDGGPAPGAGDEVRNRLAHALREPPQDG